VFPQAVTEAGKKKNRKETSGQGLSTDVSDRGLSMVREKHGPMLVLVAMVNPNSRQSDTYLVIIKNLVEKKVPRR
jgi:hypothetical protein